MIVEFLEDNEFVDGWVVDQSAQGGRMEVAAAGRVMRLHPRRVLVASPEADPGTQEGRRALVAARAAARAGLAAGVDLEVIWSLLEEEMEGASGVGARPADAEPGGAPAEGAAPGGAPAEGAAPGGAPAEGAAPGGAPAEGAAQALYPYAALAEIEFGRGAGPDQTSAVMRAVHRDGLYFKFTPEAAVKRSRVEIARILEIRAREARRAELRREGVEWLREARLSLWGDGPPGSPPAARREFRPPPDDGGHLVRSLTELALATEDPQPSLKGAAEDLAEAGFGGDPGGAVAALQATGVFGPHEDLDLRRLGLPLEFPEDALEEAERLAGSRSWLDENRLDLTGEFTVTVDSPGAMEFDDAVSLSGNAKGGLTLGIHIADAAALVRPGSALDRFAAERGASIYLPEGRHAMLPLSMTARALSLSAGEVRPAFSILADIGEDGQVTDAVFQPSLVKVRRHMTFAEADAAMEAGGAPGGSPDEEVAPLLRELAALSQKFLRRRLAAGGHIFNIPAQQVTLRPDGTPEIGLSTWDTPACVTVGELMIRANHLAAATLRNADFPCPFRYQLLSRGAPSPLSSKARTPREQLAWHLALRRRLGRTGVSAEPSRHRGLGLDCYTYFTSPMRRYFDLLVHRQLRSLALGKGPAYDEKTLLAEAFNADGLLRAIHKAQSARTRYWILHELSKLEGRTLTALCFDRQDRRVRLCLTDWMMETESQSFPDSVQPGHDLEVLLTRADPAKKALSCSFVANLTLDSPGGP